jgi:hypothetical protein
MVITEQGHNGMETEEGGWVTGPALDTVLVLNAMQVHDQVKLGGALSAEYIDAKCMDHTATIYQLHNQPYNHRDWLYSASCQCGSTWSLPNRVIKAWRRPKKRVG